ncbi:MAG TPA: hypothetical protein VHX61_05985 [Rhizomicrobium sp.]|jgi:uncharacterized membrane protein YccC|nr:hypothetical protein [Rhizomicrobium sp.]
MRALELIGGLVVAWLLAVGVYHALQFLLRRNRAPRNAGMTTHDGADNG